MEDELKALLQRVGLGLEQILTRKRFLQWQTGDALRLNRAAAELDAAHRAFIDKLYEHLADFGQPATLHSDCAGLMRLKQRQQEYYRRLWNGPYERDYVRDRLLVGLVHQRVGVDRNGTSVPIASTCRKCCARCSATTSSTGCTTAC